jgi:hypothetical protein
VAALSRPLEARALLKRGAIAGPPLPRFNGACPSSPAAAHSNPLTNAGMSITVTRTSARFALRAGMPPGEDPWDWNCGFYPGSHPGECTDGTAATFKRARADFEKAWRVFLSKRTEADFQAWRDQRDWTTEKYRRFDRHERMPSDWKPQRHASG